MPCSRGFYKEKPVEGTQRSESVASGGAAVKDVLMGGYLNRDWPEVRQETLVLS